MYISYSRDDKTLWQPKSFDRICNEHFVDGAKSANPLSPGYNPTIFPNIYKNKNMKVQMASNRHKRFIRRNKSMNKVELKNVVNVEADLSKEVVERRDK